MKGEGGGCMLKSACLGFVWKISPEPFVTRIGMVVLECELDSHVKKWVAITTIGRDICKLE